VNYRGPGRYRHYKGGEYFVLGLALQEDTVDNDEKVFVIYKPLTPGSMLENRLEDFWARELGDFNAQITPEVPLSQEPRVGMKQQYEPIPRFTFVGSEIV